MEAAEWPKRGKDSRMSQAAEDKGSWFLKTLGLITVVGILIAVGRIVMKVLNEEESGEPDAPTGV